MVASPQKVKDTLKIRIKRPQQNQIRVTSLRENKFQKGDYIETQAAEGRLQQGNQEN